jgi:uroporphyrinogen-III decarboxylase
MTGQQWETLLKIIRGEKTSPAPIGFVIDCPWLPNWYGMRMIDYFSNDDLWLQANLKAIHDFSDVIFMPGFWSEYGMCTEPSAFGARCSFPANEFPHAHKVIRSTDDIKDLPSPNPKTDGLLPLVLNRLKLAQPKIQQAGHDIRFAVARGPLNIASYLMGSTEFLTAMMLQPEQAHALLKKITSFLKDWLHLQIETFPSIDGIFLLDDIIGFIGEDEFREFALPFFKEILNFDVAVKFLHNDAACKVSAPFLPEMGVNLFNMGFDVPLHELARWTNHQVTLLGNIPPRDILANGTIAQITAAATALVADLPDWNRVIFSCGGGMPPGVSSENLTAFINAIRKAAI